MKNTTNYNLNLPESSDFYNIEDFNENAELIDTKLKEFEDGTTPVGNAKKLNGKEASEYALDGHKHTKSEITDFPTSMPASDVYSWAKASSKPSYTKAEVGLGNVDNTADSAKSVKYATSAGSANAVAWENVSGKPSSFTPASHTHTASQITGTVPVTISASQPSSGLWVVP